MTDRTPDYNPEAYAEFQKAKDFINRKRRQAGLPRMKGSEACALEAAWFDVTCSQMSESCNYAENTLNKDGSQLWKDLSEVFGEKVDKFRCREIVLERMCEEAKRGEDTSEDLVAEAPACEAEPSPTAPGAMSSADSKYLERPPLEENCYRYLKRPGALVRLKAPDGMGKTWLIQRRILPWCEQQPYRAVWLDLDAVDGQSCQDLQHLLRWFCQEVSAELGLYDEAEQIDTFWSQNFTAKQNCKRYFRKFVLPNASDGFVLAMNNVNALFDCPVSQDFFSMLRAWFHYTRTKTAWKPLRLLVAYSYEDISLPEAQSPFNVGEVIELPEFDAAQVGKLAQLYGLNVSEAELDRLMETIGGYPKLVSRALKKLNDTGATLSQILEQAATPAGIYSEHLFELRRKLRGYPDLVKAMQQLLSTEEPIALDHSLARRLDSLGLVKLVGNHVELRCKLYRLYFAEHLG